jgi:hypothetical protein
MPGRWFAVALSLVFLSAFMGLGKEGASASEDALTQDGVTTAQAASASGNARATVEAAASNVPPDDSGDISTALTEQTETEVSNVPPDDSGDISTAASEGQLTE